ncbi:MAG: methyltransferase, TrmH family [Pseudonocardiales bacterium]|nr:methyltransferase, TrmH family [Pseudonocardiales bacterium]
MSVLSDSNARLAAARRLTSRRARREAGRFLAEGAQAVREALSRPGTVIEIFGSADGLRRHAELFRQSDVIVSEVSDKAAASLSETVTPQGLVAVCRSIDATLDQALASVPTLAVILVDANDPGNAGTILRTADAAGAQLVIFAGDSVDPYNGKAVRATAGSLFHLDVVTGIDAVTAVGRCRERGLLTLATSGRGADDLDVLLDDGQVLAQPTAWLFGNEAHGLPAAVIAAAHRSVRVPVHGSAESLNLAAAAAVCLYSSARAQRAAATREPSPRQPKPA